ncbi:hypothetical protein GCM10027181_30320 [Rheinheimera gaetbuli]
MSIVCHNTLLVVIKDALLYKAYALNATRINADAADSKADKINWHKKPAGVSRCKIA